MHVLPGKFLELVRMKQDPLRVLPKAQFPHSWRGPRTLKKRGFACPNLSSRAGELDAMHGSNRRCTRRQTVHAAGSLLH